jgi:long-chain acyl-CoA synthetase
LWLGQNCHRLLEGLLACAKLGSIFCPVNWRQSADELAFNLQDATPKLVLWQREELGAVHETLARGSAAWLAHDTSEYEALIEKQSASDPEADVAANEPLLMMYTAAFSGRPSGALLSSETLALQGLTTSKVRDIDAGYSYLNCGPLFHAATFMYTMATYLWGGKNVFVRKSDPAEICRLIERESCNGAFVVGPTIDRIVQLNREHKYNLKSLRSHPGPDEWNAMVTPDESPGGKRPGGYGQTELGGVVTVAALGHRASPFAEVRVVDDAGKELGPGQIGEIVVRGPLVMHSYFNRPQSEQRRRDGWHLTGDLGRRDENGALTFIGPKGRLIKSGFENVYAAEVEACLKRHPAVRECAVIGIPDEKWGQSVKAIIVKKAEVTAEELIEHCKREIASYKKPRSVELVEALPKRGHVIDYDALDQQFGGGGYPGAR